MIPEAECAPYSPSVPQAFARLHTPRPGTHSPGAGFSPISFDFVPFPPGNEFPDPFPQTVRQFP
jgi:hypothetical protein